MTAKNNKSEETALVTFDVIERKIYIVREQKVMLDSDLAALYGVATFNLNQAVKRNPKRFPEDFMFQLTAEEYDSLKFQIGISNKGRGERRRMPYVFTEQGVAMLSSVLDNEFAVQVNIKILRAFVRMRKMLLTNEEISRRIAGLENKFGEHDKKFEKAFAAIRFLIICRLIQPNR